MTENQRIPLLMAKPDLAEFPQFPLPEPFSLRFYRTGDEKNWYEIHLAADHYSNVTPGLFTSQFGTDRRRLAARQLYLCDGAGQAVGTTSSWLNEHFPARNWGRVHWVAILPEYQGKGLAKPMLSKCLGRLRELRYDGAYLTTSTVRIAAVNLYLGFGFVPFVRSEREVRGWHSIRADIKPEYLAAVERPLARF